MRHYRSADGETAAQYVRTVRTPAIEGAPEREARPPTPPAAPRLKDGDRWFTNRALLSLQHTSGNRSVQRVLGDMARHAAVQREASVQRQPAAGVQTQRYNPPPGVVSGALVGRVALEDVGHTGPVLEEIIGALPAACKGPGAQGIASVRATYTHDNIQQHIVNMTHGSPLATQIKGQNFTDNYRGDVAVTAYASNFQFVRADGIPISGAQSRSSSSATGSSSTTTGMSGGFSGSAGGHEGAPGGGASFDLSGSNTRSGSASMGGMTTRGAGAAPESVLFTCDLTYSITVRYKASPRVGWDIVTLGLVEIAAAIIHDNVTTSHTALGRGAQVRFQGADCPPA